MGQTVNLLVFTFGGSNPSSPTLIFYAEVAQLVEHNLAKVGVASSSLVFRSNKKASEIDSEAFSFNDTFILIGSHKTIKINPH